MKQLQKCDVSLEEKTDRLLDALDEEIRGRGWGAISALGRATGHSEGWWQHRAGSGNVSARQLFAVLDHLGLDPVAFLRRALGAEDSLELDRPRGAAPEVVGRAWERWRSGEVGDGVGARWLETLDRRRYEEPGEVVEMASWGVEHAELELLPRLLGVAGSAWRLLIRLDEAEHAIQAGMGMAEERGDRKAVGDLLQRLSYVAADRGNHAEALRRAETASWLYLRSGDREGFGKALVDQGIMLSRLGRPTEAIATQLSALHWLPESLPRSRCTAFQVAALSHRRLGELEAALRYVTEAERLATSLETISRAKITWLEGEIHIDMDQLEQAEACLLEAVNAFRPLHLGETALATCDLVKARLLRGRSEAAYAAAISTRALLEPLRGNKIISAALGELLRSGEAGLTLALVERVKARIEGERQHLQRWRSLKADPR